MIRAVSVGLVCVLLIACQHQLVVPVKLSQLSAPDPIEVSATMSIELPGCNDYKDSRIKSKSLMQTIQFFEQAVPEAKFLECYRKDFDSLADFSVPVHLGGIAKGGLVAIYSSSNSLLIVNANAKRIANIKAQAKQSNRRFNTSDIQLTIDLVNDTGRPIDDVPVLATYVDGIPFDWQSINIPENASASLTLSNVSFDKLISSPPVSLLLRPLDSQPK